MKKAITTKQESSYGPWARRVRKALKLTQQELAVIAGVSQEEVDLFEHNFPVRLEAKHKLLKELWAARYVLFKTSPPTKKH